MKSLRKMRTRQEFFLSFPFAAPNLCEFIQRKKIFRQVLIYVSLKIENVEIENRRIERYNECTSLSGKSLKR